MAAGDDIQWWCRTDGDNSFGGGYDSAMPSAGTNYCDQATAQLALTDLATSGAGVKTITSVTGGFTAAMIGNCIRIASGTNFTAGYYWIDGYTDTNTITVTVSPTAGGAGSAGNGKIGGAFLGLTNLMAGAQGGLSNPTITSPLAAGHTINLRGTGGTDPSSHDYDYSGSGGGYWAAAIGSSGSGRIRLKGYNGRPCIKTSFLLIYPPTYWTYDYLKFIPHASATYTNYGFSLGGVTFSMQNCIVETNGLNATGFYGGAIVNSWIKNTGGGSTGQTMPAIRLPQYASSAVGCVVSDTRGDGYQLDNGAVCAFCISDTCGRDGFSLQSTGYPCRLINCTSYASVGDNLAITNATDLLECVVVNFNSMSAGSQGIDARVGTTVLNDKRKCFLDYSNFYNDTTLRNAISAGAHDTNLDPGFTDAANGNFTIGTNLKAAGFPGGFPSMLVTGYLDIGAVQRQETGGTSGGYVIGS